MLDNLDSTKPLMSTLLVEFEELSSKYDALLSSCSVRTNNVLSNFQRTFASKMAFLSFFFKMSTKEFEELKNCGRKTVKEIEALQESLVSTRVVCNPGESDIITRDYSQQPGFNSHSLPGKIDTLLPLVMPRLEGLSVRARNAFLIFLEENHGSLAELYAAIIDPRFNPAKMKNVGRNTQAEITDLLNGIKEYLESFPDEQAIEDAVTKFFSKTLDNYVNLNITSLRRKECLGSNNSNCCLVIRMLSTVSSSIVMRTKFQPRF